MLDVQTGCMDKAFLAGGCNIKMVMLVLNFPRSHPFCRQTSSFPVGPGGMTDITHNGLSFWVTEKKMKAVVCLETPHHSHKAGSLCSCCWSRLTAFMVCLSKHEPKIIKKQETLELKQETTNI